jgi:hypothetical protein
MPRYQQLIKENLGEIAKLITVEQGKTLPDAEGDVMRGLQVGVKTGGSRTITSVAVPAIFPNPDPTFQFDMGPDPFGTV